MAPPCPYIQKYWQMQVTFSNAEVDSCLGTFFLSFSNAIFIRSMGLWSYLDDYYSEF